LLVKLEKAGIWLRLSLSRCVALWVAWYNFVRTHQSGSRPAWRPESLARSGPCGICWRREVKTKTKIHLLVMSKVEREKRLDELNRKLGIDSEEIKEREWLKRKLGYKQH